MTPSHLYNVLAANAAAFHPVVQFDPAKDKLLHLDFTAANSDLTDEVLGDVHLFSQYVRNLLNIGNYTYGIGGYDENRTVYSRSRVFDDAEEPRRLHLGIDIWAPAGTPVYAPLHGTVHSFGFNDNYGDYGATIILQHDLEGIVFHTLYGHLGLHDLSGLQQGQHVNAGDCFAHFGEAHENGHWPPHLHFQLVEKMHPYKGDYPGVCRLSEKVQYLANSPDPDVILNMMQYAAIALSQR